MCGWGKCEGKATSREVEFMKNRINWVDIIKFFGIFTIYLGHFGEVAGLGYGFVYSHHVPLFFLVSGCMEIYNQEKIWVKV